MFSSFTQIKRRVESCRASPFQRWKSGMVLCCFSVVWMIVGAAYTLWGVAWSHITIGMISALLMTWGLILIWQARSPEKQRAYAARQRPYADSKPAATLELARQDPVRQGKPAGGERYQFVQRAWLYMPGTGTLPVAGQGENADHVQCKAALRRQDAAYQSLADNLPQGLITFCKTRIMHANPAAGRMLGGTSGQIPGTLDLSRCVPPSTRARELDRLHALQQGVITGHQARPLKLRRLDGSEFDAEVTEILLEGDEGRDVHWLVRDVSQDQKMRLDLEEANTQLKNLSQRLIEIQEVERRQIARDLHDDIGQHLTGLKLHLQRLMRKLDDQEIIVAMGDLVEGTDQALAKARSLSLSLHPLQLETLGLEAALRWHLSRFLEATHTVWALQVHGQLETIASAKAVVAFRIVQEAVNNAAKHAQADNLRIMLSRDDAGLRLEILDDGCGFDIRDAALGAHSLGLTSMRERVASLGGHLTINSLEGVGTRITAWLPAQRGA